MDLANKPPPPASQLNPHEAVELIDLIIRFRISRETFFVVMDLDKVGDCEEKIELAKRRLTDYFLASDGRKGIYVKGPNDG